MNTNSVKATLVAAFFTSSLLVTDAAFAQTVLQVDGGVSLTDGASPAGTTVSLKVDLNRDGEFARFETISTQADTNGDYALELTLDASDVDFEFIFFVTDLISQLSSGGFDALIDEGPLTVALFFEKEGYSTVVHTFGTNLMNPQFAARLSPLEQIFCDEQKCSSPSGSVEISELPANTGIVSGYAQGYDPAADADRFPGSFVDASDNLLISSGFMEVDFRDDSGAEVAELSSPADVRFQLQRDSWPTLVDQAPGSGIIEVPMYSFDKGRAQWVPEDDGVLETPDGQPIPEGELAAIHDQSYAGDVYVAFSTDHFSAWNVDEPVEAHTCIKGRLVGEDGLPLSGLNVGVRGVSYVGSAPGMATGADGYFAAGMMKSEAAGEDVDRNGTTGETFQAQVMASGAAGVFLGASFDTPATSNRIVNKGGIDCVPTACACQDLGDVVVTFTPPRLCQVTVAVTFDGQTLSGEYTGELAAGAAVTGALVWGEESGSSVVTPAAVADLCADKICDGAPTDADGRAVFHIPMFGGTPTLELNVYYEVQADDGMTDIYLGSAMIDGCAEGETEFVGEVEVELAHLQMTPLWSFIAALDLEFGSGSGGSSSSRNGSSGDDGTDGGCFCSTGPVPASDGAAHLLLLGAPVLFAAQRRRTRARRRPLH